MMIRWLSFLVAISGSTAQGQPAVNKVGNNGLPADLFPLQLCQGDCDNDGECAGDLGCFQRGRNQAVYGCSGGLEDGSGTDFCYDTTGHLHKWGNNGLPAENFPLKACQGDCDRDSECDTGLRCFQRGAYERVPGCEGAGASNVDYCYVPPATPSGYSDPFWGFCEHRNALYDLFQKDGLYTDPYQGPGVCAAFCSPYESSPGYVGLSTKIIDGACACNFDDGSMPFPVPDGATEISDRLTVGPVTDGNLQNGVDCYPFLNYVAATPSPVPPTPPPTRSPLPPSLQFPRPIETVGNNGLPAAAYPLDSCLGDCDNDSECQPGLYCFQRAGGEDVPGCIGGAEDSGNNDYCFQRPSNYLWKMGNNWVPEDRFPLGECEGDCDKDGDCGPGLKCFQRDDEPVAGCVGAGQSGIDYCWDYTLSEQPTLSPSVSPVPPTPPPTRSPLPPSLQFPRPIETVGNNGLPAAAYPLDSCLGDCDNDSECQPGLYCFQRAGGEDVPGCIGGAEDSGNNDYCFQRPSNYLWKMGNNWVPEDRFPLGECEGDCDKDGDCGPGLKCFQRDDEPVAGCVGAGQSGIDYCWDYTLSEQPTLSPSVSPTPKPTSNPSMTPTQSPSVSPTTASPSAAPTLNEVANIFDMESYVSVLGCNSYANMLPRAIDGSTDKFVCDRTGIEDTDPASLIFVPSHNKVSVANALRVYSHNDCSGCDPATYLLEGRSSPSATWSVISSGDLPWNNAAPSRNYQGQEVVSSFEAGDTNLIFTEVSLTNDIEYLHYKLSFTATRDPSSSSLQFAEVELAGVLYEDYTDMDIINIIESVRMSSTTTGDSSFVQALSCPSIGSSKVAAAGTKLIGNSQAFCGILIKKSSGSLIPYARSYSGHDWEPSPGPFAATSNSISCDIYECDIALPDLEDTSDIYVVIAKKGTSPSIRNDITRFLEMTSFGPKMSEIDALDNGSWDETDRALYVRNQMDMAKTSHREYFRARSNAKWEMTTQEARSDHACSPNSKWRRYAFTMADRYNLVTGANNVLSFEPVAKEAGLSPTIYEADAEEDVTSHGGGQFSNRYGGFSGTGFYDFVSYDFLEFTINVAESVMETISFRYSAWGSRPCQLIVNDMTIVAEYGFTDTKSSGNWMYSELIDISLNSGSNSIKLVAIEKGPNIDHLQVGKQPAVLIKQNGQPRAIAKNGLHLMQDYDYEFTEDLVWDTYPYPRLAEEYPYGKARVNLPDGRDAHLDVGNPYIDFTGYEEFLPSNHVVFDETHVFVDTASDLYPPYVMHRGDELLLENGIQSPICDLLPEYSALENDPIFGRMSDGSWVQWTPTVMLEPNGPSINDPQEEMTNNVLSDGGGEWSEQTGGTMKCSAAERSFVNEKTCFLSYEATSCSNDGSVDLPAVVCGSLGEIANNASLPESYGIKNEEHTVYKGDMLDNQKTWVWTDIALKEPDQLHQRLAYALSQVFTNVPSNIAAHDSTELHLNFYDILVRLGLKNYRDIIREISFSPIMAEHLTYHQSKSTSFVYENEDGLKLSADENYAREVMQLFSIGLLKLNDDGTLAVPNIETYTNKHIESFARGWTGFSRVGVRGNIESERKGSSDNRLDPLKIIAALRDPFPKMNLKGGFIGDGFPLCTDLPVQSFLKTGATYRLMGARSLPQLMIDPDEFADSNYNISRLELVSASQLYQKLYNGGNYELTVELDTDLPCTLNTIECVVDTARVVKVGSVYYEFVERPCVQQAFYNNGKQIQMRLNTNQGTMCANPLLADAREACCNENSLYDVRKAEIVDGVTHFYDGERMSYATAKSRCVEYGKDLCVYETVTAFPNDDDWRKGYHWTNKDCGITVKVNKDTGYVAIVHDAMSTYKENIPWLVDEEHTQNWFHVTWDGNYPGSDATKCASNGCKTTTEGHCLCKTIVTESTVFSHTSVSKEDVIGQLFIGAIGVPSGASSTTLENGLKVHIMNGNVDGSTIFEIEEKGKTTYLKNVRSTVSLEGWTMLPKIYEAEDAEVNNANVMDNTASATGGEYVNTWSTGGVNSSTYVEWIVNDIPSSGEYVIALRYANDYSPRPLNVFVNGVAVLRELTNPNSIGDVSNLGSSPPLDSFPLQRCEGDCDNDSHCTKGLFCMQRNGYEATPGCVDTSVKRGYDYCMSIQDFDYGFTLLPTGGWDDDWHKSKPLKVDLIAGQNNTIRVQIPPEYTNGPNIDHLEVMGLPTTSSTSASFRNPPQFISLIPDYGDDGVGEQDLRDAQYETEAVIDDYVYHDNVAPFLCPRIMQRFGISDPSRRYVTTCVKAFRTGSYSSGGIDFGSGEYGSLEAMAASILLDSESTDFAASQDPSHGSMREPILKVMNLMRSMEYETDIPTPTSNGYSTQRTHITRLWNIVEKIGNGPHDFPSVFGHYLPDYKPKSGPLIPAGLYSPESSIVTMPNLVSTLNGMFSLIKFGLGGCNDGLSANTGYGECSDNGLYESSYGHLHYQPIGSIEDQVEDLSLLLTAGRLNKVTKSKIVDACSSETDEGSRFRCMQQLVVSTSEFHSTNHITPSGEARETVAEETSTNSTEPYKTLVYYYLSGGMDSYNMLAPYSCSPVDVYDRYRKVRGQSEHSEGLGLPLSRLLEIQANSTDQPAQPCSSFGIHENLANFQSLYNSKELLFVSNAGLITQPSTKDNYQDSVSWNNIRLFAHDAMCLETQLMDAHDTYAGTGYAGRLGDVLTAEGMKVDLFSIYGESELLVGVAGEGPSQFTVSSYGVSSINEDPSIDNMNNVILDINNATTSDSGMFAETFSSKLTDIFSKQAHLKEEFDLTSLKTSWVDALGLPVTGSTARQFQTISRIMQTAGARGSERDVFYVSTSGWDHHSDMDIRLADKFTEMNNAIGGFVTELRALNLFDSTVLVQFSEFARTLDPNTGGGSDHAWGGQHFMLGGKVKGGKVLGRYPDSFEKGPDNEIIISRGRVVPTTPWDAMLFGVTEWMGVPTTGAAMDKVLPMHNNFPPSALYSKNDLFNPN